MPLSVQLSVVVPVYGCAPCLTKLTERIRETMKTMSQEFGAFRYEVILVDDRGRDGAWDVMRKLYEQDPHLVILRLSRNFGQHAAITAGLTRARGKWVVVMDCDLQDPPEEIRNLYFKAIQGNDIVYARRIREGHGLARKTGAKLYTKLLNTFAEYQIEDGYGTFSIISRAVVDAFLSFEDSERHYLHILSWLGFSSSEITYKHQERYEGKSSYTLRSLIRHATSGVFFQTTVFLRMIVHVGFWISALSFMLMIYFMIGYFIHGSAPGWTSLSVLILFVGGVVTTSVGVCGLYIGRIFDQVRHRPIFVVAQALSHDEAGAKSI